MIVSDYNAHYRFVYVIVYSHAHTHFKVFRRIQVSAHVTFTSAIETPREARNAKKHLCTYLVNTFNEAILYEHFMYCITLL